jgi:alkylation response protein AidB-like acyl-CoA dehydrogenase
MLFALSPEQAELAATVRSLLAKRSDVRAAVEMPRGYDESLWTVLCDQVGVAGLAIPEEYGGAGFTLVETQVLLEELGADLAPTPLLGSGVLGAQALLLAGDDSACAELLPGMAAGTTVAALAWAGTGWSTTTPPVTAAGTMLSGETRYVLDGDTADVLLVIAATGSGPGLFRVDPRQPAVRRTHTPGMDRTLRLATVTFDRASAEPLGTAGWLPTLRDIGCVAVCGLQVGAMQRCLDLTVAHTKQRVQFGRPIGSFQALKHRMADMLVQVETSRSLSWAAAWSAARREAELPVRAATAKAWCSEALNTVAGEMVQLHGGVAITWEHDAQLYFKRAHALCQLFGQPHEHRRRLARLHGYVASLQSRS